MISQQIFTRLPARLPRLCDFDTVCDLQAQTVKNSEATSKRHAAGLAKEGIVGPDGDDPFDGEDTGDVTRGEVELGQPPMLAEVAANIPGAAVATTTPAAITPTATTPSRKDEESAEEPAVAETPSTQPAVREGPVEADNVAAPPSEEPNVSSDQPRPSIQPESIDQPGPSKQPGTSASGSGSGLGFTHEAPPAGPVEADEGNVSLFDFSATEICSHLVNNDIYIGKGWQHVKSKSCNRKMEFFFNCHSLMISELAKNYKYRIQASREIRRLREQASILATEKLSTEESYAQQLAQLRESSDGHLSAQLAVEDKLSAAEEEIRSLKELLSTSQESFAARLEAERMAEEAKEKAEHEAADLRNQLSSRDLIFDNLKAVLEAKSVDRFKRSPAYDALFLREFEKGMR
ncbi:hypothetical protein LWI29_020202 [Acer saccharum]|uniref:Uncharacterized protein n=1 Tax=Acer saccharum TaxID=4024 RepID=A0AA39S9N3_ACESA|nr:hypothetical protein LWI29_020202 [Acer saccharum]